MLAREKEPGHLEPHGEFPSTFPAPCPNYIPLGMVWLDSEYSAGGSDGHPGSASWVFVLKPENGKEGKKYNSISTSPVLVYSMLSSTYLSFRVCQIRIRMCHSYVMKININSLTFLGKSTRY